MFSWFEKLVDAFPNNKLSSPPKNLLSFCIFYTRGVRGALISLSILSALIAILEVNLFNYLGHLVDWFATRERSTFLEEEKTNLIWMSIVILFILPGTVLLQSFINNQTLHGNFPMRIRWLLHKHLLSQSISFFQNEFSGRVASKLMQTALSVQEVVRKLLDILVYISVYFISILWILFSIDWRLTIPLISWLVIYIIILWIILPRLRDISKKQANTRADMYGRIIDSYTNIKTVKLFSHTHSESQYAHQSMSTFMQKVYPQMRLITLLNLSVWLSNSILIFLVSGVSIFLWMTHIVSPGDVAIAVGLSLRLNGMSQWIMWEVSSLFENIGTIQDGINTLAIPISLKDNPNAKAIKISFGAISFKNVYFSYGDKNVVINNLNLEIKPGEKVGLVGRSGSGKSTIINLLLRFYDIKSGVIMIDGENISKVSQASLRQNISMVTQDPSLLHRTVRENILYGSQGATEEQLILASRQAEAHDFIQLLSDSEGRVGYDSYVGERGVKLSGGQRQRIALARVMLRDAPILILDEATSALDSETESIIQESLDKIIKKKTVLTIAHRLSTIALMDRLIVIDHGHIVESGTHLELIKLKGIYASLWERQAKGFIGFE